MTDEVQFNLGSHAARLDGIESRLGHMETKLDRVVLATERVRGGWQALIAVGTISGAIGAGLAKFIAIIKGN